MNYSEFLSAFYVPEVGGGLIGFNSKNTIPFFFIQNGLRNDYKKEFIEQSASTYTKWLTGARKPSSTFWAEAANKLYPSNLEQSLLHSLNPAAFISISRSFGLPVSPDNINKAQLAHAIAKQFAALATGRGQADNIIPAEYNKTSTATISNNTFEPYLGRACQKLRWLKPLEEDAGLIKDLYVCNNLGKTAAAFPYRVRGNYIENATLPALQHYDKYTETNHILIIGACGYGKTLMLQHLFLDAATHASETKKLPVFAEIKDFMPRDNDLKTFLLNSIKIYDPDFSNDLFDELLTCGSVQILLDGLDEMDPQETRFFQQKLSEFQALYSQNQIIITSRQCAALRGIRLFSKLYIHPLTDEQVSTLIDKHLTALSDMDAKETIYAFMNPHTGYIKPNSFIATNPMLLTLLITKRHELQDMQRDMIKFYACMYDALVRVHDLEKEAFGRFFHSVIDLTTLTGLLKKKKNIILQGAPGVGKTYAAKRIAYALMGEKNQDRVMMVQFHQSYSYEDFIEGFRPGGENNNQFVVKKGSFYRFCKKAGDDLENDYYFIIDEINRGNMSRIFGELFMLIEADKRGNALQLLYSDEKFTVPGNVYIIGTMNTADRSLALLDYALRRRFAFYDMKPGFESKGFQEYQNLLDNTKFTKLISQIKTLNEIIAKDDSLGEGFCIGHSYFCDLKEITDNDLRDIVEYEIAPLLREYWYDEKNKAENAIVSLKDAIR